ncbi:MAG: hypothetical protein ACI92E_000450 [Oceanicoccus sp.]|jgi:hypothetical protein
MKKLKTRMIISCIVLPILLASCMSAREKPKAIEVFKTQISQDGTKIFVYRFELPEKPMNEQKRSAGQRGKKGHGNGPPGRSGSGRNNGKNSEGKKSTGKSSRSIGDTDSEHIDPRQRDLKLKEKLETALAENGFCREGYEELDRHEAMGEMSIRGECSDEATDDDRRNFPNSQ